MLYHDIRDIDYREFDNIITVPMFETQIKME